VGLGAGLDDVEKGKYLTVPGLELRPPRSSSPWPLDTDSSVKEKTDRNSCAPTVSLDGKVHCCDLILSMTSLNETISAVILCVFPLLEPHKLIVRC
jgi:hypothetical protein